ncbi:MAG TPA: glycoside hydrolase family 5 protein [Steroidobacteraceae bacterium]|nr:glycoside hydrolase family 5 protein [Steroidobacteraceae bacterium]
MKQFLFATLLAGAALVSAAADQPLSAAAQVAQMKRGVNIVGYDPIWQDATKARFKPRHFKIIKDGGFDTVRINLYGFRPMNEKMQLPASWYATLDALVDEAVKQGLNVILDEHDYEHCSQDAASCRAHVLAFWSQVAEHYKDAPGNVVYEILNEPSRAMDDHWNALIPEALAIIRKTNPTRNVVIGPAFWNNISHLPQLELPEKDRHIIVTVHYYEPHEFTHQGARWSPEYTNLSGIHWGTAADYAKIDENFDKAQAWAKQHDRPILLGEFGAYDKAPQEDRVKYTAAVARAAEKRGWAFTYWQFDSNFVVYEIDADRWNEPIYRALVPAAK